MSRFINIRGSMVDIDVFGQIQPIKMVNEKEEVTYKLHFYDKDLNHRMSYTYTDIEELKEAVTAVNSAAGIKIQNLEQWL